MGDGDQMYDKEFLIFHAAIKLLAHHDMTVERAVKMALQTWEKSIEAVHAQTMTTAGF